MNFRLYRENGALNSVDIFDAFASGIKKLGHNITDSNSGIPVIWSVLWHGRMIGNRYIYQRAIQQNRPIIILEIGNLVRGITWRISVNHVNRQGFFGNNTSLDFDRNKKLGIELKLAGKNRNDSILIAAQHERSLQWDGNPCLSEWASNITGQIRKYTDRPIIIRPHPRAPFKLSYPGIKITTPQRTPNTYDSFDIKYNFHCVINHNSGPGVQAAINGTPIVVDASSLAYPVSDTISNIDNPSLLDRTDWFIKLCHTEWTREEIAHGEPLKRLLPYIESKTS